VQFKEKKQGADWLIQRSDITYAIPVRAVKLERSFSKTLFK
jgi:hypothetical protein